MGLLPGNIPLHVFLTAASFIWRTQHSLTWTPQVLRGQGKGVCSLSSPVRESLLQALRADVASRLQWTRASRGSGPGAGAGGGERGEGGNAWSRRFGKRSGAGEAACSTEFRKGSKVASNPCSSALTSCSPLGRVPLCEVLGGFHVRHTQAASAHLSENAEGVGVGRSPANYS